nr:hypothetical protein CFP56_63769 [Quercus suber]
MYRGRGERKGEGFITEFSSQRTFRQRDAWGSGYTSCEYKRGDRRRETGQTVSWGKKGFKSDDDDPCGFCCVQGGCDDSDDDSTIEMIEDAEEVRSG